MRKRDWLNAGNITCNIYSTSNSQ